MKTLLVLACLLTSVLGAGLSFFGLIRLGWGRHGTSLLDLRFLHLDWIFQPGLPYWGSHMGNLAVLSSGLVLIMGPLSYLAWRLFRESPRGKTHAFL